MYEALEGSISCLKYLRMEISQKQKQKNKKEKEIVISIILNSSRNPI